MIKRRVDRVFIEVEIPSPWLTKPDDPKFKVKWLQAADEIKREIKRHVDGIENTDVRVEETEYCEFCGNPHNEPYWCCGKSIDEIAAKEKLEFGL